MIEQKTATLQGGIVALLESPDGEIASVEVRQWLADQAMRQSMSGTTNC